MNKKGILCIGAALIDILLKESDDFLKQTIGKKGGMYLVDKNIIQEYLSSSKFSPDIALGGSACNTAVGIGRLGGDSRFVGKSGNNKFGVIFEDELKKNNVKPFIIKSESETGMVLSIITPDAERTMFTYIDASSNLSPSEIEDSFFKNTAIVHIEGYLLFNPDIMTTILKKAKKFDVTISLDLASYTVVENAGELLHKIVNEFVDIVIANEDEAKAYTGSSDDMESLSILGSHVDTAVLKLGGRGSYISHKGKIIKIAPAKASKKVIDTTGAGDLWASGFLYGLVNGYELKKCGEIGSACGCEVCQVIGSHIPQEEWLKIKKILA